MIPTQELVHKKKCLLPDIRASGATDDFVDAISPRGIEPDLVIFESNNNNIWKKVK